MFKFPAGEVHPKLKLSENHSNLIFFELLKDPTYTLSDHVLSILLSASQNKGKRYYLPYLPFSRQDRDTGDGGPFSLKAFGDMLNVFGLREVVTMDVHSDVAFACIDNLTNITIEQILDKYGFFTSHKHHTLVIPDSGAYKKLAKLPFKYQAVGRKVRNTDTGLLEFKGIDGIVRGERCLIVDDICDGGGTFTALTEELYKAGAESVELFVTHGIFSKGEKVLLDAGIKQIYTTNSFYQKEHEYKSVYNVLEFFPKGS